jgi:DnaJ-class molecular chaperone
VLGDAPSRDTLVLMRDDLSSPQFRRLLETHERLSVDKGGTVRTTLGLSLEESAAGGSRYIEVSSLRACKACRGGKEPTLLCSTCAGEGVVSVALDVQVDFPPGVCSGHLITIAGAGDAADDVSQESGDLVVEVQLEPHRFLQRMGSDCHTQLSLTFLQATLGCRLHIPSLYGEVVLEIPPGTQPHSFFSIPQGGFPIANDPARRGHMVVKVLVNVPQNVSPRAAALLRQFDDSVRAKVSTEPTQP